MQVDDVQQPRRPPESRRSAVAPSTPTEVAFMGLNSQTRGRSVVLALLASGFAFLTTGLAWPNPNVHVVTPSHTVQRLRHGPATTPIQHVVVIIQENRTVDNIFNGFPGADTAQGGYDSHGNFHELRPISFSNTCGPSHSHGQFVTEFNGGSNNGWDLGSYSCTGSSTLPDGLFAYVQPSETEEYWAVASNYGLADEVLQTSEGPSFPAHQYLIAGQAGGHGSDAPWGFAENGGGSSSGLKVHDPDDGVFDDGGGDSKHSCGTTGNPSITQIDLTSAYPGNEGNPIFPCKDYETIFDLGMNAGLTWKYYAHKAGNLRSGVDSVSHLWNNPSWHAVVPETTVLTDIANHNLANIVYVTPAPKTSDHPHASYQQPKAGPKWVAEVVNAIGQSSYWSNTTILITWDDWGGWFDHVNPSHPPSLPTDPYEWGYRVPLIVVSPYTLAHNIDHTPRTFASVITYIESTFNLGSLGFQDGMTDNLSDMFNYSQEPLQFIAMPTK
jgi:phospholipase C